MRVAGEALIVAVRAHGEHGAIVRALTPGDGVLAGYVRGGKSRRTRPILLPGNRVEAEFRSRTAAQLAFLSVELVESRAALLNEPLAAAAVEWACALTAASLPEGQAYPRLYLALSGLLGALEAAPAARDWALALLRYELLVLAELGFEVEPALLDRLPVIGPGRPEWPALFAGLRLTGDRLARDLLTGRQGAVLAARERLVERLKRVES